MPFDACIREGLSCSLDVAVSLLRAIYYWYSANRENYIRKNQRIPWEQNYSETLSLVVDQQVLL